MEVVERASSEILYSSSSVSTSGLPSVSSAGTVFMRSFARSRRSLAEPSSFVTSPAVHASSGKNLGCHHHLHHQHQQGVYVSGKTMASMVVPVADVEVDKDVPPNPPPMIAPVGGVPNLKGKSIVRPIPFRPVPKCGAAAAAATCSGASTPTNSSQSFVGQALTPASGQQQRTGSVATAASPKSISMSESFHSAVTSNSSKLNEGFAPGHPLVKEGKRHFGSSQELHATQQQPQQQHPPAFNKFNSLDRRAIAKRHQNHAKIVEENQTSNQITLRLPNETSSCQSLPPTSCQPQVVVRTCMNGKVNDGGPSTPYGGAKSPVVGSNNAINISGLPEPNVRSNLSASSVKQMVQHLGGGGAKSGISYSSQDLPKSTHRSNAATPQFQNLSGTVVAIQSNAKPLACKTEPAKVGTLATFHGHLPPMSSGDPYASSPAEESLKAAKVVESSPYIVSSSMLSNSESVHHNILSSVTPTGSRNTSGCFSASSGSSGTAAQGVNDQTPSPSDSAVGDLESALREKDNEIKYLRGTVEQNEQAYEEKEKMWEKEIRKIKGLYDNRLRASQQKSSKMEQALTNQTYQLQSDKRKMEKELEEARRIRERQSRETLELHKELYGTRGKRIETDDPTLSSSIAKPDLEAKEVKLELERCENKVKEMELSKKALGDEVEKLKSLLEIAAECCPSGEDNGDNDVRSLDSLDKFELVDRVRQLTGMLMSQRSGRDEEVDVKEVAVQKEIIISRDQEIEKLQLETTALDKTCRELKQEVDSTRVHFQMEKSDWLEEKEKVIRYQKQLQLNYVQMYKRNKVLESEIEGLNKNLSDYAAKLQQHLQSAASQQQPHVPQPKTKLCPSCQRETKCGKSNSFLSRDRDPGTSASSGAKVSKSSSSAAAAAQNMIQKTGNSVRARLLKMSLHSESQC